MPPTSLLVCGWNDDARRASDALASTGAFQVTSIVDRSGLALVEARRTTGLACSQLAGQTLDAGGYGAVLLSSPEHMATEAARAARRGASLLVLGDHASGATLRSVVETAHAYGVSLHVLSPALHDPALVDLLHALASKEYRPHTLDIEVEAATDIARLLPVANSFAARLLGDIGAGLTLSAAGSPELAAITVETAMCFASLRVRHAPTAFIRISGTGDDGAFDLRVEDGTGRLVLTPFGSMPSIRVRTAIDGWRAEAQRITRSGQDDIATAATEASLLTAIEAALIPRTSDRTLPAPTPVAAAPARPALRLLRGADRGGSRRSDAPTRALHLVSAP